MFYTSQGSIHREGTVDAAGTQSSLEDYLLGLDLDGDDEARPNSCEKNPWAGRAESAESEELRLDVDGGSIARCLGSTAFMYGATARKWDSPAGVATGSAGRVSWTFW